MDLARRDASGHGDRRVRALAPLLEADLDLAAGGGGLGEDELTPALIASSGVNNSVVRIQQFDPEQPIPSCS